MSETIIGHEKIRSRILELLEQGRFPQTSLWHGQAGSGKKMLARQVARVLLESEQQNLDNHPDFFLITPTAAKSMTEKTAKTGALGSIKIEQVAELKRRLMYPPLESKRQVVIIDDAELMTHSTANSLLKILEEPRPQQIFILITGQMHRLLMTIRSRALRFYFPPLKTAEIRQVLARQQDHLAGSSEAELEFFLRAFAGSLAHIRRAVEAGLKPEELKDFSGKQAGFAEVSTLAKRLLQNDVDVPVFLQALRLWQLQNIEKKDFATAEEIDFFDRIMAAETRFAKHIQSEFLLENLFL